MSIHVAIVEDNRELRESLTRLVDAGRPSTSCVGAFARCEELLRTIGKIHPSVVLMDIGLPGMSGIEGVRAVRALSPATSVLMLTVYEDEESIFDAIRAGASGYLVKKALPGNLLDAIRETHAGGASLTASIARKVLSAFQSGTDPSHPPLSGREREILSGLVNGQSYKMIADSCSISLDTVRSHIKSIYDKLHVHSKSEAVAAALKGRLL